MDEYALSTLEVGFVWLAGLTCAAAAIVAVRVFVYARGFDEGAVLGCILAYFLFRRETLAVMIWCAIAAIVTLVSLLLLINGSADFGVPGLVISLPSLVVLGRAVLRELHWWDA